MRCRNDSYVRTFDGLWMLGLRHISSRVMMQFISYNSDPSRSASVGLIAVGFQMRGVPTRWGN